MSLGAFFRNQDHKTKNGYFLNHHNLIIATPEERKKLIFYFIASNLPQKLKEEDHLLFESKKQKQVDNYAFRNSIMLPLLYLGSKFLTQSESELYIPLKLAAYRNVLGISYIGLMSLFTMYLGYNLTYMIQEPKFIQNSEIVKEMAEKYSYSIYDFQQSKKEAQLYALKKTLVLEKSWF